MHRYMRILTLCTSDLKGHLIRFAGANCTPPPPTTHTHFHLNSTGNTIAVTIPTTAEPEPVGVCRLGCPTGRAAPHLTARAT